MAKVKMVDSELHGTRGLRFKPKSGLTGRIVSGEGFCKKAGMFYKYTNFNKEGTTNQIEYFTK